jgi:hypothetical protein
MALQGDSLREFLTFLASRETKPAPTGIRKYEHALLLGHRQTKAN